MSTILDALKKSEQERRLKKVPTLSDMPAPVEQSRWPQLLILLVLALLLMTMGWIAMWYLQDRNSGPDDAPTVIELSNDTLAEQAQADDDRVVVNVVSWSEQAEQRFVMIDGKLYREDEFVRPGLKVEEIKTNSVVLNQRGQRMERRP